MGKSDRCWFKTCRRPVDVTWLKRGLCFDHWITISDLMDAGREAEARRAVGLPLRRGNLAAGAKS